MFAMTRKQWSESISRMFGGTSSAKQRTEPKERKPHEYVLYRVHRGPAHTDASGKFTAQVSLEEVGRTMALTKAEARANFKRDRKIAGRLPVSLVVKEALAK